MRSLAAGVSFLALLFATQAVAAGTMLILANLLTPIAPDTIWPWFVAGLSGVGLSVLFLIRVIEFISRRQRRSRASAPA